MVLSDDAFKQVLRQFDRKKDTRPKSAAPTLSVPASASPSVSMSVSETSDADDELQPAVLQPPARDDPKGGRSKSTKRGASSSLSGPSAKK